MVARIGDKIVRNHLTASYEALAYARIYTNNFIECLYDDDNASIKLLTNVSRPISDGMKSI